MKNYFIKQLVRHRYDMSIYDTNTIQVGILNEVFVLPKLHGGLLKHKERKMKNQKVEFY